MHTYQLNFENYQRIIHIKDSLERYLNHGIMPGGFLTAVLSNDLTGAFSHADHINYDLIGHIVKFLYNEFPIDAWGSPENVSAWVQMRKDENTNV